MEKKILSSQKSTSQKSYNESKTKNTNVSFWNVLVAPLNSTINIKFCNIIFCTCSTLINMLISKDKTQKTSKLFMPESCKDLKTANKFWLYFVFLIHVLTFHHEYWNCWLNLTMNCCDIKASGLLCLCFFIQSIPECLEQGWANFLTGEPQWVLQFDGVVGIGADGWRVILTPLIGGKNI